ncbi:putative secreted protein [Proteiniphilum saccharofermentans]|uniref:Putative secreted protein n=1 Tax=Proteiniphilum saccharofermentans TaxID=1642647 RepID=A0A1R3TB99_9BACT|nr:MULTISPECIES: hypothetical protein [Dysgonomonadaceae]MDD3561340.1 hypothetical protein [Petrimonas mucosa]SCD21887.1 putative secreted protein [Proteiniphilum saccharofermentans]
MATTKKKAMLKKRGAVKGSFKTGADVIRELEEKGIKLGQGPKSKIALFREKYPEGVLETIDMDAILE